MAKFKIDWPTTKEFFYKQFSQKPGEMMTYAVVLSMATSCIAQVLSVVFNKKMDKKEKKFIIPQEIADGVINAVSSLLIIGTLGRVATKLVSSGKWSNAAIRNLVKNHAPEVKMGDISTNIEKTFIAKKDESLLEKFYHSYDSFKNGIAIIATSIGSVISCNIVTPILRNSYASGRQKKAMEKQQINNNTQIARINSQNDNNYRRMYTIPINNSGSMKI